MNIIKNSLFSTFQRLKPLNNSKILMPWGDARAAHSHYGSIVNPLYSLDSVTLRPVKLSDAHDFLKCACDDQVTKLLHMKTMTTEDEAIAFITKILRTHAWSMSICMHDRSVGFVSTFNHKRHKAVIGYCLARKYWGQGIMTHALKMSVKMVLKDFPEILRLEAFTDVANLGSQRVLEKAGFKKEGLLRKNTFIKGKFVDNFVYSFLSDDVTDQCSS